MEDLAFTLCKNCHEQNPPEASYCGNCGSPIGSAEERNDEGYITKSVVFYVTFILYLVVYYLFSPDFPSLITEILLESVFGVIILIFSFIDLKNMIPLFKIKGVPVQAVLIALGFPIGSACIVYFMMGQINLQIFGLDFNMYEGYAGFPNAIMWSYIFIAFVPALFEELGFRGYLFNQMLKIASPTITIIVTGFLFALMHMSFISMIWLVPFGIFLGYLRLKYNVIWLGMIVHFIHNAIVLGFDIYYF